MTLSSHVQSVMVAKRSIQHEVGQRDTLGDPVQQGLDHAFEAIRGRCAGHLRCQCDVSFTVVLDALWTSRMPLGSGGWLLLSCCFGLAGRFLRFATYNLLLGGIIDSGSPRGIAERR